MVLFSNSYHIGPINDGSVLSDPKGFTFKESLAKNLRKLPSHLTPKPTKAKQKRLSKLKTLSKASSWGFVSPDSSLKAVSRAPVMSSLQSIELDPIVERIPSSKNSAKLAQHRSLQMVEYHYSCANPRVKLRY